MLLPLRSMRERVQLAREDSDSSYFAELQLLGELAMKLAVIGFVTAIELEPHRHKYRQLHRLVRANGLGEFSDVLEECLSGVASQALNADAYPEQRDLTQPQLPGTWQYDATAALVRCLATLDPATEQLGPRVPGRRWFALMATMRNKRAHGAPTAQLCKRLCPDMERAVFPLVDNLGIFQRQWAYLHRNLSGKYRITTLGDIANKFEHLKASRSENLADGVYICWDRPTRVDLIESDPDGTDFFLPNGGHDGKRYEVMSYRTGLSRHMDAGPYQAPPTDLPPSETEGGRTLELLGQTFANLPAAPPDYVARQVLEAELRGVLLDDRNPLITLAGGGGVGKTSLTLAVLHALAGSERFGALLWFSSRDVDLLPHGPRQVSARVLSVDDIAKDFARQLEPPGWHDKIFDAKRFLAESLGASPLGKDSPVLFVFDNFETLRNPADVFGWISTHVRLPNKVLITTRVREFKADYHVTVGGMTDEEATLLIGQTAQRFGVGAILTRAYADEICSESEGHPYVIKILLGEVAKTKTLTRVIRIVAAKEDVLEALFERTYAGLTPAGKRVFLLMACWRSAVPRVALEATLLRPANERMDVANTIEELWRSSMIELHEADGETGAFVSVPMAAGLFGRRKMETSPYKSAVDADSEILQMCGASQGTDFKQGVAPKLERLFGGIATSIAAGRMQFKDQIPMLEFIARRLPQAWLWLTRMHEEFGGLDGREGAKETTRRFLEAPTTPDEKAVGWELLVRLCRADGDVVGEIQALAALCEIPGVDLSRVSRVANRVNEILRTTGGLVDSDEKRIVVQRLVDAFETRIADGSGDDLSRLAWLLLHAREPRRAAVVVRKGLKLEPTNYHLQNLKQRLERELSTDLESV